MRTLRFGFYDESYVDKALDGEDGFLRAMTSLLLPLWNKSHGNSAFELTLEPVRGLKILLTSNLTDNRTRQVQCIVFDMPTSRRRSYTYALGFCHGSENNKADDGYASAAFTKFLENIPA